MKNILLAFSLLIVITASAQSEFITQGRIEFERKINVMKMIEGDTWYENFKDKMPKFVTTYFNLSFKDGKTLYEKGRDTDEKPGFNIVDERSDEDIIFTDLNKGTFARRQAVFEESFLLSDSIRKIDWKITNETRDIAGFECRKAVGRILDSVYIIAFYTDQIPVSGGPMSYTNLPGMILGIAIPRVFMSMFATKVELIEPASSKLVIPTGKLKKTDYKELTNTLQKAMSDWGRWGQKYLINFLL
jgi:GLPGLI family protein